MHDHINAPLFNEIIKKDKLPYDYFEQLKSEGHQYIINVKRSVDISTQNLEMIPIQFYHIDGFFDCSLNQLKTLKGSPQIVKDFFNCGDNQLESLRGCSQIIHNNHLNSLIYFPDSI